MMNICFATDDNYVKTTAIAIMTVLLTNKDEEISFYILSQSLTEENKEILKTTVLRYSSKSHIQFCILTSSIIDKFSSTIKKEDHVSLAAYLRLFIPSLIPDNVQKILYLDGDIICVDSLRPLYETDLKDYSIAAIYDDITNKLETFVRLKYEKKNGYFNSGVMLLNLNYWRLNKIQEKVLDFMLKNKEICVWHDQDALNKILNGTVKFTSIKYNVLERLFENENNYPTSFDTEIKEAVENPVIIHFATNKKPWVYESKCPFTEVWLKLYKHLFDKKCSLSHLYKGKTLILWKIKRFVHKIGLKKYNEFAYRDAYKSLRHKIILKYFS